MHSEDAPTRQPRVLVIDDDPDTVYVYTHVFGGRGFSVEVCGDGTLVVPTALALQPDVILMDYLLPGNDGWNATRALKAEPGTAKIPVIGISAYGDPEARAVALRAGCIAYFEKPVSPMLVLTAVQGLLADRELPIRKGCEV